jgi:hypothetical protein
MIMGLVPFGLPLHCFIGNYDLSGLRCKTPMLNFNILETLFEMAFIYFLVHLHICDVEAYYTWR